MNLQFCRLTVSRLAYLLDEYYEQSPDKWDSNVFESIEHAQLLINLD